MSAPSRPTRDRTRSIRTRSASENTRQFTFVVTNHPNLQRLAPLLGRVKLSIQTHIWLSLNHHSFDSILLGYTIDSSNIFESGIIK